MNWQNVWDWLKKTHEPEPGERAARARAVIARFDSSDTPSRMVADRMLREVAFLWESLYDEDWAIALLDALADSQDGRPLLYVRHLAEARAVSSSQKRVKEAARRVLPFVEARAQRDAERSSLLRSSTDHKPDSGDLLRPTSGDTVETAPDLLLRPMEALEFAANNEIDTDIDKEKKST